MECIVLERTLLEKHQRSESLYIGWSQWNVQNRHHQAKVTIIIINLQQYRKGANIWQQLPSHRMAQSQLQLVQQTCQTDKNQDYQDGGDCRIRLGSRERLSDGTLLLFFVIYLIFCVFFLLFNSVLPFWTPHSPISIWISCFCLLGNAAQQVPIKGVISKKESSDCFH